LIRQAISCDICGTEKKQTNHWFVAYDQAGELRVSGWSTRNRLRQGAKHLCGQTCLHKLVDEFMARSLAARPQPACPGEFDLPLPATNASLTSAAAYNDTASSARLVNSSVAPQRPAAKPVELVTMPSRPPLNQQPRRPDDPPVFMSRQWRAEAWEREREREMRALEDRPDIGLRRRSS
jgi:hypothetical protein